MPNNLYAASPMRTPTDAQEVQEMQAAQEMRTAREMQAVQEMRTAREMQAVQEMRTTREMQDTAMDMDEPVVRFVQQEGLTGPGMYGSMQEALADNLGLYAVCEFVVGTQNTEIKEGILYSVGRSFLVLYDERQQNFILCDIFSIKFATLYMPGHRPWNLTRTPAVPMVNIPGVGTVPAGPFGIGTGSIPHLQNSPRAPGVTMAHQMQQMQ